MRLHLNFIYILSFLLLSNQADAIELNRKQSGTATMSGTETNITVTLPFSVDMSSSILLFTYRVDADSPGRFLVGGELSSTNQLAFIRNDSGAVVEIEWQVLEFLSGITVQRGATTVTSQATNVALPTEVSDSRSWPIVSYYNIGGQFGNDDGLAAELIDNGAATGSYNEISLITTAGDLDCFWQVIECASGQCQVEALTASLAASATSATSTITLNSGAGVTTGQTMLFTSHDLGGNVNGADLPRTELTNGTTITHTRTGSAESIANLITYVVEFTDGLTSVQHGTVNFLNGINSETASVSSVNLSASAVYSSGAFGKQGSGGIANGDNPGANWFTFNFSNSSTVVAERANATNVADVSYQVVEFDITPPQTWYVYIDGDWSNPDTWTLDAATAPLDDNPSDTIPGPGDQVVIYSGRNVTVDVDTIAIDFIEVRGNLDLASTTGHDFGSINGNGIIRTRGYNPGTGLEDNFPAGTTNSSIGFGDPANGGTLVIEGTDDITISNDYLVSNNRPFKNMRVDRTNTTDKVILAADMYLSGNLDVRNGDVQINDNTNTTPLLIEILNDVDVSATGNMSVGDADANSNLTGGTYGDYHRSFHTVRVGGDFTNLGTVRFTNQVQPVYNAYTTTGAVSLVFNRASDAVFNCQGTTDLYNLVIDKGTDQTYELQVFSDTRDHFALFGRIDLGNNDSGGNASHPEQQKALYIANGTLRLTGQVYIPTLNEGGRDYEVGERAALVLDGPDVFVQQTANNSTNFAPTPALSYNAPTGVDNGTGSQSFTLFGRVRVEDGLFRVGEPDNGVSLLFRNASPGVVEVNGGTFEAQQFTFSNTATTDGVYSVVINGGTLRLWGTNVLRGNQTTFHLPFENNVFTMTGGMLEILQATTTGALVINSSAGNINVTGGTVRLVTGNENSNRFSFTSSAPFYDLVIRNERNDTDENVRHFIEAITDDVPNAVPAYDLRVLNDLTIETGTLRTDDNGTPGDTGDDITFGSILDMVDEANTSATDVYVGGSFIVEADADYISWVNTPSTIQNTTFFNQTIGTDAIETFEWNNNPSLDMGGLTLDRITGNEVRCVSPGSGAIQYRVRGALEVLSGTFDQGAITVQAFSSVKNFDRLGTWFTSGPYPTATGTPPGAQIRMLIDDIEVDADGAVFGNVQINSNPNNPVAFVGDVVMERFEHQEGTIYIGTNNLRIDDYWGIGSNNYRSGTTPTIGGATETWIENPVTSGYLRVVDEGRFDDGTSEDGDQRAFIITDGNASDGGLSLRVTGNTLAGETGGGDGVNNYDNLNQLTYPIGFTTDPGNPDVVGGGINTYYRPAQVKISDFQDDGYITIRPVSGELQTTDLGGGDLLQNYWRVTHSDFTDLPMVAYRFYYRNQIGTAGVDLPTGFTAGDDLTNFVPGKVLDGGTFQRSYESNSAGQEDFGGVLSAPVDADTRVIIFNGNNTSTTDDDLFDFDATNAPGFTLENANYTAGVPARFVGAPTVYYSRWAAGWNSNPASLPQWNVNNTWSTDTVDRHSGAAASSFPQAGDIAIVRTLDAGNLVNVGITNYSGDAGLDVEVAELQLYRDNEAGTDENDNRVYVNVDANVSFGVVKGNSTIQAHLSSTSTPVFTDTDFGEFVANAVDGSNFLFYGTSDGVLNLPASITAYPRVRFEGNNNAAIDRFFQFPSDASVYRLWVDSRATFRANRNLTIETDFRVGSFREGYVQFDGSNGSITIEVGDDFILRNDNDNRVFINDSGSGLEHRLIVADDLDFNNNTLTEFDLFTDLTGGDNVILELTAEDGTGVWTNDDPQIPELYQLVMNGGNSVSNTFSIDTEITLPGATATFQPLEILNGLLVLNDPNLDFTIANGSNFFLPNTNNLEAASGSGGLEIAAGTVKVIGDDAGIVLDGLLRISGGTLDMDDSDETVPGNGNNFIEYSTTGNARLEISAGVLDVGSQVRRPLTTTSGILNYSQSGGDARFGINAAPVSNRGIFEVLNDGSVFEYTSGSFSIIRDNGSASVASLRLTPETASLGAGQVISMGTADTPGGQSQMGVQSSIPLETLQVGGTSSPTVKLYSLPLELDNLLIGSGGNGTFDANGFDLTINESLQVDGTFSSGGNSSNQQTTFFPSSGTTTISGTGAINFWEFDKTGSGTVSTTQDLTVENNTFLRNGTLNTNSSAFFIGKDLIHNATHSSILETDATVPAGIVFNGNQKQQLSRSTPGSSIFGMLRIDNSAGVEIPGSGENFQIDQKLTIAAGAFDIGGNLMIFPEDAYIENATGGTGVADFNVNNMIQTNSSIVDFGVRKIFSAVTGGNETFTYPVGLTAYTPLVVNITDISAGSITARPVSSLPPIAEDDENTGSCTNPNIVDANNVLQYYWILKANGVTGLNGELLAYYDNSDAVFTAPYTIANYGPARLFNTDDTWDKVFTTIDFDESNEEINYPLDNQNDNTISGIYTAGVTLQNDSTSLLCGAAIPDQVPQFTTTNGGGNYFDGTTYDGSVAPASGTSTDITVRSGDVLNLNQNNIRIRKVTIENGGTLVVNEGIVGINLGFVIGEGTIALESNSGSVVFPTGDYEDFFPASNCIGGGGLEYRGSGSYGVLSSIPVVRDLTFDGSGTRTFPNNNNLLVCDDLSMLGTTDVIIPDGNNEIIVRGDVFVSDNTNFMNGGGNSSLVFQGTSPQLLAGSISLNIMEVDNAAGVSIVNNAIGASGISADADVVVEEELKFTNGLIQTDVDNTLTVSWLGSITGESPARYVNGPLVRRLQNSTGDYKFPVGTGSRYGYMEVINPTNFGGSIKDVTVNYITSNPGDLTSLSTDATAAGVVNVSDNEYWTVTIPSPASSIIQLKWDNLSSVDDPNDLQVMFRENGTSTDWDILTRSGVSGTSASGTITTSEALTFSTQQVTFGTTSLTTPLPIELLSFTGKYSNGRVRLNWVTASETGNDYFEIQKSLDGEEFSTIATMAGAGDSNEELNYIFDDYNVLSGNIYYRLKQNDFDGKYSMSKVIMVKMPEDIAGVGLNFDIYPNPTRESQGVRLMVNSISKDLPLTIEIFDTYGTLQLRNEVYPDASGNQLTVSQLPPGIYLVMITQDPYQSVKRLMIGQ